MAFSTLGTEAKSDFQLEESYSLAIGFICKVAVEAAAIVKYDPATNKVEPLVALADVPFGHISVGTKEAADGEVTVVVPYVAVVRGIVNAAGAIALGDKLGVAAYNSTKGLSEYAVQTAGNFVVGQALTAGAVGDEIWIGLYRTFGEKV